MSSTHDDRDHDWVDPEDTQADIRDHLEANTYAGAT